MTLDELKKLAGVDVVRNDNFQSLENISKTAQALKDKERKLGIKPGDPDWFKLWFSKPYMTGPVQFRSRQKKR
tara:strand:+ start:717 stop:935 length:219 start_codon:yes stop_codon:yes gene_type:complete